MTQPIRRTCRPRSRDPRQCGSRWRHRPSRDERRLALTGWRAIFLGVDERASLVPQNLVIASWDRRVRGRPAFDEAFRVEVAGGILECRRQRGRFLPGAREPGCELDPGNLDDPHWRVRAVTPRST